MRYGSLFNYVMADFHRPAAFVSALILFFLFLSSPAEANYIYNAKTGVWTPTSQTVLAPPGSSSPFTYIPRENPPSVSSTGAFQSKTGGTFGTPPVNGVSRTVPVTITGTVPKPFVNKALLSRLTKGGLAGIALGVGVETLLSGIGALIDEGGNVVYKQNSSVPADSGGFATHNSISRVEPTPQLACTTGDNCRVFNRQCTYYPDPRPSIPNSIGTCKSLPTDSPSSSPAIVPVSPVCPSGSESTNLGCTVSSTVPVPPSDLESAINSDYQPQPSDYPLISSDPNMQPKTTTVEPIPSLQLPSTTTTTIDLDTGKTTTTETNIWHNFDIRDNDTAQPKINMDTNSQTDTYQDGQKTSTTTNTTSTGVADPQTPPFSGSASAEPVPTDCDFFPTACAWMEWTQQEPEEPEDNLSDLLQEVPIDKETYTITGGAASCPAPIVLNLSQFGSREVSYQPLCDLASTMKYLYLALMAFAAAVLLNRSINRV